MTCSNQFLQRSIYSGRRANAPNSGSYSGRFGDAQLQFVRNLLKHVPREHLVVVSMHIPLVSHHDGSNPADTTVDRRALLELLSNRLHTLSLSGHMHTTEHHYLGAEAGFLGPTPHHRQKCWPAAGHDLWTASWSRNILVADRHANGISDSG